MTELDTTAEPLLPALPGTLALPPSKAYWVYLNRFTGVDSARTMRGCLDRIAIMFLPDLEGVPDPGEQIPWEQFRYEHVSEVRKRLAATTWSPSHVNKHLSALRGVLKEAWRLGLMSAEDYQRAADVKNAKGTRELAGRSIHGDEFRALLEACLAEPGPLGIRDAAIVAVLQSTGIRRAEAAGALIERYDPGERSLRVIGKGDKERTVYVHPGAVTYLERWLAVVESRRGPVFRRVDRWGNIGGRHLSARSIGNTITRRRGEAHLQPVSTHDFRRTFIGDFIDAGGDVIQAQIIAGHASPATTAAYDRRPARGRRAAVDRLSLPPIESLKPAARETI